MNKIRAVKMVYRYSCMSLGSAKILVDLFQLNYDVDPATGWTPGLAGFALATALALLAKAREQAEYLHQIETIYMAEEAIRFAWLNSPKVRRAPYWDTHTHLLAIPDGMFQYNPYLIVALANWLNLDVMSYQIDTKE